MIKKHTIIKIRKELADAIAGVEHDYTDGSLKKAIFLLSIPMVLEMVLESVFAIVDIYFVSQLGAAAVATVGLTESFMSIIYSIAMGFAVAASAMVSRRIGENKPNEAAHAAMQAIIVSVFASGLIAYLGFFHSDDLLRLMGASDKMVREYGIYTKIILSGNIVIMLLFVINSVFRGAGDASLSLRVLWLANMLNIILDPIMILGFGSFEGFGIAGAAWATTFGRGLAVLFQIYILVRKGSRIRLKKHHFRLNSGMIKRLLKLASGSISQSLIATTSWVVLMRIVSVSGDQVLAGYTIALRIIIFTLLPAWGLSNAAATLIGQNLGAKNRSVPNNRPG